MRQKQMSNNEDVSTFFPLVMLSDLAISNINLLSNFSITSTNRSIHTWIILHPWHRSVLILKSKCYSRPHQNRLAYKLAPRLLLRKRFRCCVTTT